ncbi:MAG: oligosaccharide flippase family protein [Planctomycetaceae bacterium]|nr:oligosaccharide flippase family protein [Planctomycetaceae bacterium]
MGLRKRFTINLLATWSDHVLGMMLALILMPLVLGVIGDSLYGTWVLISAIAGYSGLLSLGLGQTISRYVAAYHAKGETEQVNRVVNVIGAVYLVMSGVALAIAGVLAWLVPVLWPNCGVSVSELRWVILILGANVAVSIIGSVFGGVLVGLQRFDLERAFVLASGVVRFALTLLLLQKEWGLLILAFIFLATTLAENLGYVVCAWRLVPELRFGFRFLNRQTLRECYSFSAFAFLEVLATKLIESTDCVVIGCVLGTEAIVPYYVAQRLCQYISKPLQCIASVCLPRAGELHAQGNLAELRDLMSRAMGLAWLLVMAFFIGASFFGPTLMATWVHKAYPQSQTILLVLLGSQLIGTPMKIVTSILFGMGEVRWPSVIYVIEAVANLALSLSLVYGIGLVGVALGTAIPLYLVELGLLLPHAMKRLEFEPRRLLTDVAGPQLAPLVALLGYSYFVWSRVPLIPGWGNMLAIAGGGGLVLGATWLGQQKLMSWLNGRQWAVNKLGIAKPQT